MMDDFQQNYEITDLLKQVKSLFGITELIEVYENWKNITEFIRPYQEVMETSIIVTF